MYVIYIIDNTEELKALKKFEEAKTCLGISTITNGNGELSNVFFAIVSTLNDSSCMCLSSSFLFLLSVQNVYTSKSP